MVPLRQTAKRSNIDERTAGKDTYTGHRVGVRADHPFEKRIAIVTFEDSTTTVAKLTAATTNSGFPSEILE